MKFLFFYLILSSLNTFAGFEKILVEKLDFDYSSPYGKGVVEKVGIGQSFVTEPYEIEVLKTEDSFELVSSYVDFSWKNPLSFFFDIESIYTSETSAGLGTKTHYIKSKKLIFKPKGQGDYYAEGLDGSCEGHTSGAFVDRVLEDCRIMANIEVSKLKMPSDFILYKTFREILNPRGLPRSVTVDDFLLKIQNGDFNISFSFKYWINIKVTAYGELVYNKNRSTIAIKLSKLKLGHLPLTYLFLLKLKELVKSPGIIIDPPWIKIKVGSKSENLSN